MRVFAIHDAAGIISEVVIGPDDSPVALLRTDPSVSVTEIEIPADVVETELQSSQGLTELIKGYRVQVKAGKCALVSR